MTESVQQVVVEFRDGAPGELAQLAEAHPDEVSFLHASAFNATDPSVTEALIILTPVVLRAITTIVRAQLEARKHVSVKVDGVELTGMSGKDALEVLQELADRAT